MQTLHVKVHSETISDNWKPFKNDENFVLLHVKSSFRSWDIYIFVLTYWLCKKSGLIRRLRLIPKFITSQTGQQIITIHILSIISRRKDNQTVKFSQLTEYNVRNIFLQKSFRKWGRETSSRPLLLFKKALRKIKINGQHHC